MSKRTYTVPSEAEGSAKNAAESSAIRTEEAAPKSDFITPEQIVVDYEGLKLSRRRTTRSQFTRASSLGHPCTANLAWQRVAGEKAELPSLELQCIFDEGETQEKAVKADLRAAGYDIIEEQRMLVWDACEVSGHIDGKISKNGSKPVVFDVKSISPFGFIKLNTSEDVLKSKQWYYSKNAAQLQMYMLMEGQDRSILILKNKSNGRIKAIPMELDYEYAESLLKKAEEVKRGVHLKNEYPLSESSWNAWLKFNRLNDVEICSECPFKSICLPEIDAGVGVKDFNDPEMAEKLSRRAEIQATAKEFEELDGEIKEETKKQFEAGNTHLLCGNFAIRGKEQERNGKKFWKTVIERI